MTSSAKKGVQLLISHFVHLGVKHIVFSAGSRNAPLVIAFRQHPYFETIVIPDERSAAFYALGMIQQLQAPVAIVCTSGSAVLNYAPAVAEAFYQQLPLIVLSADRPSDWIDQGDGQTIRQENSLANHVRYSTQLRENLLNEGDKWYNSREIARALHECNGLVKGPVHLNFPFTEPLYEQAELDEELQQLLPTKFVNEDANISPNTEVELRDIWKKSERIMILVGQQLPDKRLFNTLKGLNNLANVVVMVENTSNLFDRDFVQCIDRTLDGIPKERMAEFVPDLLITLGGAIVSKKIKHFFRENKPKNHWKVGFGFPYMDTYQNLTMSIPMEAAAFLEKVESFPTDVNSNFGNRWKQIDFLQQEKLRNFLDATDEFCDLKVFDFLLDCIPDDSDLHLGNSSVIRYSQLFNMVWGVKYWCNRGTSGIDGSVSTACGASLISKNHVHSLIVGDLSFFYDSNAFFNNLKLTNLRVFVINNGGGDIFNIIKGPNTTAQLEENFVAKHQHTAEGICQSYGVKYFAAHSLEEIESQMHDFYAYKEGENAYLMEIFTNEADNSGALKRFLAI